MGGDSGGYRVGGPAAPPSPRCRSRREPPQRLGGGNPLALAYCDDAAGRYFVVASALGYSTTIQTPPGCYHDEGITGLDFRFVPDDYHFIDEKMISSLTQTVPLVVAPGNSPLVHNGRGCGDPNHVHIGSGECK